jgi:argininosuccinate synthase
MKVALAYSGGLDTSAIVPWLIENYHCEVIAVVGDVGQGADELNGVEQKAKNSGASACYVVDLKREFVEDYALPTMIAGAIYDGKYLLGTAIARPILAKAQVEVALQTGCDALSHGCTGKGNDQVRFESAFAALAPELRVIAPWREWDLRSRESLLNYLAERNIPCAASREKIYSRDRNLWHVSHEGGALEDPWNAPPEDCWLMSVSPTDAPNAPEDVTITFDQGYPVSVNGVAMAADDLLAELNTIAGKHGVGRIDLIENRCVGMKSRGCYETPGGTVIVEGLRAIEELVLDRDTRFFREELGLKFARVVYDGKWFTPIREALWASAETIGKSLTGEVVVRLHKGKAIAVKRRSPNSLYSEEFATFGEDEVYNQQHAEGFIRLHSLPQRIAALKKKAKV